MPLYHRVDADALDAWLEPESRRSDVDEKEQCSHAVASRLLLIGRSHGRDQNATGLEDGEGSVLRVAADRVEDDVDVAEDLFGPRLLHVNDPIGTEGPHILDVVGQCGRDYVTRNPLGELNGVGAHISCGPMDQDSLRCVYRSVVEDHPPCCASDDRH